MKIEYNQISKKLLEDILLFVIPSWMEEQGGCDCNDPNTCSCIQLRILDVVQSIITFRNEQSEPELLKEIFAISDCEEIELEKTLSKFGIATYSEKFWDATNTNLKNHSEQYEIEEREQRELVINKLRDVL